MFGKTLGPVAMTAPCRTSGRATSSAQRTARVFAPSFALPSLSVRRKYGFDRDIARPGFAA
jgi:hypothetical protein